MTEKIQTLHPDPNKKGVNIDRAKYDLVRKTVIASMADNPDLKPMQMFQEVGRRLKGKMEGSGAWYSVTVKLDMEARGELGHDRKKAKLWLTGQGPNPQP